MQTASLSEAETQEDNPIESPFVGVALGKIPATKLICIIYNKAEEWKYSWLLQDQ